MKNAVDLVGNEVAGPDHPEEGDPEQIGDPALPVIEIIHAHHLIAGGKDSALVDLVIQEFAAEVGADESTAPGDQKFLPFSPWS